MGHWTTLETERGQVAAWHATPAAPPRAALVVIQEVFGANAHIRAVAEGFAEAGFEVLAPAFFDLVERDVELDYDDAGLARGRELVQALGTDAALDIVAAAARVLAPTGKVGTVGYCWGGTIALLSAIRLGLPSVSYYGARNAAFLGEMPKAPVMFHFGSEDPSIPAEAVQQHHERLPQMQLFEYPAGHAFNRAGDPHYHEPSARLARERTLTFLSENLR